MIVDYANSKTSNQDLDKKISEADIVVLSYPLNENTIRSFNKTRIALMKKNAILINVARGLVVDQDALYEALKDHKILGAGLDVFNKDETLSDGRKDIIQFAKLNNVVATPHIAFNTYETIRRLGKELITNIERILEGKPINIVNP